MTTFETIDHDQLAAVSGGGFGFDFRALLQSGLMGALQGGIQGLAQGAIDMLSPFIAQLFGGQAQSQPAPQQQEPMQQAADDGQ
jgi:bacteriocin-like protein